MKSTRINSEFIKDVPIPLDIALVLESIHRFRLNLTEATLPFFQCQLILSNRELLSLISVLSDTSNFTYNEDTSDELISIYKNSLAMNDFFLHLLIKRGIVAGGLLLTIPLLIIGSALLFKNPMIGIPILISATSILVLTCLCFIGHGILQSMKHDKTEIFNGLGIFTESEKTTDLANLSKKMT